MYTQMLTRVCARRALAGVQLDMQPEGAFYKMVESYDFTRDGRVGLDSFIAMNIQLTNAQKMFALFDAQKTGRNPSSWFS